MLDVAQMHRADSEGGGTLGHAQPFADISGRLVDVAPDRSDSGPKPVSSDLLDFYPVACKQNDKCETVTATDFAARWRVVYLSHPAVTFGSG
jgi:hypothetical protein